jgi:hypothetical protein
MMIDRNRSSFPLSSKPSDGPCSARTVGFVDEIGNDFGKGSSAILTSVVCPRLTGLARISRLPTGRQARADLSRAKSAKNNSVQMLARIISL